MAELNGQMGLCERFDLGKERWVVRLQSGEEKALKPDNLIALEAGAGAGAPQLMSKPGDWQCPNCGDLVFARNAACRRCGTLQPLHPSVFVPGAAGCDGFLAQGAPQGCGFGGCCSGGCGGVCGGGAPAFAQPGDWSCPGCGDLQFRRNAACRKCNTPRPADAGLQAMGTAWKGGGKAGKASGGGEGGKGGPQMKPGDWNCTGCGDLQFARNVSCRRCGTPSPAGAAGAGAPHLPGGMPWFAEPGDWQCPGCNDLQFKRNSTCRKCSTPRPSEAEQVAMAHQAALAGMAAAAGAGVLGGMAYGFDSMAQVNQHQQMQASQYQQMQAAVFHQEQAAAMHQLALAAMAVQEAPSVSPATAARLGRTVRVANVPVSMAGDNLILILTGMFGEVKASGRDVDAVTQTPFAVVEFAEPIAAARALQAKTVQFGADAMEISPSDVLADAFGSYRAEPGLPEAPEMAFNGSFGRERSRSPRTSQAG